MAEDQKDQNPSPEEKKNENPQDTPNKEENDALPKNQQDASGGKEEKDATPKEEKDASGENPNREMLSALNDINANLKKNNEQNEKAKLEAKEKLEAKPLEDISSAQVTQKILQSYKDNVDKISGISDSEKNALVVKGFDKNNQTLLKELKLLSEGHEKKVLSDNNMLKEESKESIKTNEEKSEKEQNEKDDKIMIAINDRFVDESKSEKKKNFSLNKIAAALLKKYEDKTLSNGQIAKEVNNHIKVSFNENGAFVSAWIDDDKKTLHVEEFIPEEKQTIEAYHDINDKGIDTLKALMIKQSDIYNKQQKFSSRIGDGIQNFQRKLSAEIRTISRNNAE